MRTYEAVFIFRTEEDQFTTGTKFVKTLFDDAKIKIVNEEDMGDRRLAYEIKKSPRGHYYLYEISIEPDIVETFDKPLKLRHEILKYLFVRKEE